MIIHQFSAYLYGGAGTAALRHHREMLRQGIDSTLFHRGGTTGNMPERGVMPVPDLAAGKLSWLAQRLERNRQRHIIRQYERHLKDRPKDWEVFSQAELIQVPTIPPVGDWPDLVHLHWTSFLLDYPTFFAALPKRIPLVWTLHDMNPFTGGCHYSGGCKQFVRGCGNCPSLILPGPRDLSRDTLRLKRRVLAGRRLDVVSPSRWMNALAERSPVWPTGTAFHVIANGLDTEVFRPADKAFARRQLNLPADATLLAFGAEDLGNPRKGFHLLRNALPAIAARQRIECVVFGRGRLPESREGLPIIHEQGFVDSPERQALIYSAADLFALPSLEDNAPQTGLEAMACGTPVVAFDAGGIPEFVRPGETGLLAPVGDSAALARQIIDLAEHPRFRQRLAAGARKLIEADYDVRTQVRRYIELFVAALESRQTLNQRRAA